MQLARTRSNFRKNAIYSIWAAAIAIVLSAGQLVRATDQPIDLDQNAANGSESKVTTKVLQTYPVKIENTIFNNAPGSAYTFKWPGAGPGGFASFITAGPGVGTKWVWSTVYQVYSIDSPVTFSPSRTVSVFGAPQQGVGTVGGVSNGNFVVPGKSIQPSQITLSDASLSASLITFFSPEKTVATCGVQCVPGQCDLLLENKTGGTITVSAEQQDCCPEANQLICGGECKSYLTDSQNCGACGATCGSDQICSDGACVCGSGLTECGTAGCLDLQSDPLNCGACGAACGAGETCSGGACVCDAGLSECGGVCLDLQTDLRNCGACGARCESNETCSGGICLRCQAPNATACNNQCVNTQSDPNNCGGCGNVCDFSSCPSPGQGTCSQGGTCVCAPALTSQTISRRIRSTPALRGSRGRLEAGVPRQPGRSRGAAPGSSQAGPAVAPAAVSKVANALPTNLVAAASGSRVQNVNEAPVCELAPVHQIIPSGGTYTQSQTGGRFNKEIQTTVSIQSDGKVIAQGPCPQIVPVTGIDTSGVILSASSVATRDASGDGLCQPGEAWCDYFITVADLGDSACLDPVATLSSPPDQFNANDITFLNATSGYPDLPAYPGDGVTLDKHSNLAAFTIAPPSTQASDVGRPFLMSVQCSNLPAPVQLPITLGLGSACDPASIDGKSYDHLGGLLGPVNAPLVVEGSPVNYSSRSFNHGSTIPFKLTLACGTQVLTDAQIEPNPQIVALVHETLGPQSLVGINGDNGANPDDPGFSCSSSSCDYQFRTEQLPNGRFVVSIQLPDTRVFQAGFTIKP